MRTPTLQYLYLQKPITMVIVICIISVLPWIGLGDFSTKGEPREAAVAVSMLETGNWVLPQVYANEFAYKPPLAHSLNLPPAVCVGFYYTDRFHTGFLWQAVAVPAGIHRHAIAHHLYRDTPGCYDHACGHAADNLYSDRALSAIQVGRQTGVKRGADRYSGLIGMCRTDKRTCRYYSAAICFRCLFADAS